MELQKEITKLQEEYTKIILEIKKIQNESKIKKANLEEKEYEFDRENNRLFNINEDIDCNIENNQKQKEKYIKNSLEELELNLFTLCFIIFGLIGVISCLTNPKNLGIILTIGVIFGSASIGAMISISINNLYKNKYKIKLEKKYEESDEFKEYQSQLTEFIERKETIEKEHQIKYRIYKNAKDEYDDILNQINIKKEELNKLKEKLISLVFPNNLFEEVQNLTDTISYEDNTKNTDIDETQKQFKTKQLLPR